MISGLNRRAALALLAWLAAAPAHAQPASAQPTSAQPAWGLPQLMAALAQSRGATAHFTERQTSPVLSAPLVSSGTLIYVAPDYLRKTTTAPAPEVFILDHDKITLSGADTGGTRVFTLGQDPRIAGLVTGIRATLAGDLAALQRDYTVTLGGDAANWQLHLLPKDQSLARFIRAITISGSGGQIAVIDTASTDGSDQRLSISDAQARNAP